MATENVKVLRIDTNPAQTSVKDLRNELKQLKDTMLSCEQGTDEYNKALTRAAQIQHDLKEQMEDINASAMDFGQIMGNVTNAVGGMVAGFQAVKATMSMLGIENEEVIKSLKNMQNLMALTQAFPNIEKGIKSLKKLVTVIDVATTSTKSYNKANQASSVASNAAAVSTTALGGAMQGEAASTNVATVATNTFKKALISTGIGAIVVLIGVLIANLDKLGKLFNSSARRAEENAKRMRVLANAIIQANLAVGAYGNELSRLQYIHKDELDAMDARIAKMQAEGKTMAQINAQRQKDLVRRKEIANEEIEEIQKAEKALEAYFKKAKNTKLSMSNVYDTLTYYQRMIANNNDIIQKLENGEKVKGYTKESIELLKERNKQTQDNIDQLNVYISLHAQEKEILKDIEDEELDINKAIKANAKEIEKEKNAYKKLYNEIDDLDKTQKQKEINNLKYQLNDKLTLIQEYEKKGIISHQQAEETKLILSRNYARRMRDAYIANPLTESGSTAYASVKTFSKAINDTNTALDKMTNEFNLNRKALDEWFKGNEHLLNDTDYYDFWVTQTKYIELIDNMNQKYVLDMRGFIEQQLYYIKEDTEIAYTNIINTIDEKKAELVEAFGEGMIDEDEYYAKIADLEKAKEEAILSVQSQATQELLKLYELSDQLTETQYEAMQMTADGIVSTLSYASEMLSEFSDNPYWSKIASQMADFADNWVEMQKKMAESAKGFEQGIYQMMSYSLNAIGSLVNGVAAEMDKSSEEGFNTAKKLETAATVINTLGGVVGAWSSAMNLPFPANIAIGTALSALMLGVGTAQAIKIANTDYESSSGSLNGTTATPSTSAMSTIIAPVQYTQDVQGAEIEGAIKNQKVYVTESDISDTQKKVRVSEGEATF